MVELFRAEQSHMEASILQLAAGGTVRRGQAGREKKERIKKIEDKFDAGDCTLVEYLSAISRWLGF